MIKSIFVCLILFLSGIDIGHTQITQSTHANNNAEKILTYLHDPSSKKILVASHRGDWRNAPENSLLAIKNCIKMGVDIVEIDVRLTKDSIPVLMHDDLIDRTTTGKGTVADWTLDSLKTIFLKDGAGNATKFQIPTLEEAMTIARGSILVNLDKCSGYMDKAYEVILRTGTVKQAIFKGTDNIDHVRQQYGALLDQIIFMPIIEQKTPQLIGFVDDYLTENKPLAFEVLYDQDNSPMLDVINSIRKKGSRIWVNTLWESLCGPHNDDRALDDPDNSWGWVIDHGANIIQTDRPEMLLNYLRKKKLHE